MRRMRYWMVGLGLVGLLVGCGGGDDGAEGAGDEGGERPSEQAQGNEQEQESSTTTASTTTTAPAPPPVVYEVTGTGTVLVDYSIAGDRSQSREVTLPWSEEQAEEPSRLSMLVMLGRSQGDVTCRIRRGDEVLAEATMASSLGPMLACDHPPSGVPQVTYPPGI